MSVTQEIHAEEVLREQLSGLEGQWVAVSGHKLIASADSIDRLLETVDGEEAEVEVFQVPEDTAAACFY